MPADLIQNPANLQIQLEETARKIKSSIRSAAPYLGRSKVTARVSTSVSAPAESPLGDIASFLFLLFLAPGSLSSAASQAQI